MVDECVVECSYVLVLLDIDDFGLVNDCLGCEVGD